MDKKEKSIKLHPEMDFEIAGQFVEYEPDQIQGQIDALLPGLYSEFVERDMDKRFIHKVYRAPDGAIYRKVEYLERVGIWRITQ